MKHLYLGGICAALVLAGGMAAFAEQTPPTTPPSTQTPQTQPAPPAQPPAGGSIMVAGCVQRETDYRRAHSKGKGGAVGTGVGADNEYVLVAASIVPAAGAATPTTPQEATGTTGAAGTDAYEMTGPNESQLAQYVGKRVEITGKVKSVQAGSGIGVSAGVSGGTTGTGTATGTATGSVRTGGGVDITGQDLKLKELEISSVREIPGTCAPLVLPK